MDEMNGAFEEKKRRKGGKRLMQPEKAAKAAKEPRAEKPPRVPRETSGKTGKVVGIVAGVLVVAYLGLGAWASASHKIYPNVMMGRIIIYDRVVNIFGIADHIARRIYYGKSKYAQRLAE